MNFSKKKLSFETKNFFVGKVENRFFLSANLFEKKILYLKIIKSKVFLQKFRGFYFRGLLP